jgi:flavin reductase (DIM6/NTAB) family NADH-FMN oxidoreductase RutF
VWNLATQHLAEAMNETSASIPAENDEFTRSGLSPVPSAVVDAPRVLESPVNFECLLTQLIRLTDVDGRELDTWMVLGQVVAVHIERDLLNDGVYDTSAAAPILRAGGLGDYAAIRPDNMFTMTRPDDRRS